MAPVAPALDDAALHLEADGAARVGPRSALCRWAAIACGGVALSWPAIVVHRPFVYFDTASYLAQGRAVYAILRGYALPLTPHQLSFMAARSPVYGLILYLLDRVGGLWLAILVRALIAAWVVSVLLRVAAPERGWRTLATVLTVLAAGTSLPFFASYAMPDVFGGVAVAIGALFLVYEDRLAATQLASLWLLLVLCITFHTSAVLLTLASFPLGALLGKILWGRVRRLGRPFLWLAAALATGVAVNADFFHFVTARYHVVYAQPPFLSARLLADGAGRRYLDEACRGKAAYELCRYRSRRLVNSTEILWSKDKAGGVFFASDPASRARLTRDDFGFATAVLAHEPLAVVGSALVATLEQVSEPIVAEQFISPAQYLDTPLRTLAPEATACAVADRCLHVPRGPVKASESLVLALSALFLGWRLTRADVRKAVRRRGPMDEDRVRLVFLTALFAALIVANAMVCGALSSVAPRYQARIVWLEPLCALACAAGAPRPKRLDR